MEGKEISLKLYDKSTWGKGEWQEEPDFIMYQDEESGFICIIRRNSKSGILCGYISVPVEYDKIQEFIDMLREKDMSLIYVKDPLDFVDFHPLRRNHYIQAFYFGCSALSYLNNAQYVSEMQKEDPSFTYKNILFFKEKLKRLCKKLKVMESSEFLNLLCNLEEATKNVQNLNEELQKLIK